MPELGLPDMSGGTETSVIRALSDSGMRFLGAKELECGGGVGVVPWRGPTWLRLLDSLPQHCTSPTLYKQDSQSQWGWVSTSSVARVPLEDLLSAELTFSEDFKTPTWHVRLRTIREK